MSFSHWLVEVERPQRRKRVKQQEFTRDPSPESAGYRNSQPPPESAWDVFNRDWYRNRTEQELNVVPAEAAALDATMGGRADVSSSPINTDGLNIPVAGKVRANLQPPVAPVFFENEDKNKSKDKVDGDESEGHCTATKDESNPKPVSGPAAASKRISNANERISGAEADIADHRTTKKDAAKAWAEKNAIPANATGEDPPFEADTRTTNRSKRSQRYRARSKSPQREDDDLDSRMSSMRIREPYSVIRRFKNFARDEGASLSDRQLELAIELAKGEERKQEAIAQRQMMELELLQRKGL